MSCVLTKTGLTKVLGKYERLWVPAGCKTRLWRW